MRLAATSLRSLRSSVSCFPACVERAEAKGTRLPRSHDTASLILQEIFNTRIRKVVARWCASSTLGYSASISTYPRPLSSPPVERWEI